MLRYTKVSLTPFTNLIHSFLEDIKRSLPHVKVAPVLALQNIIHYYRAERVSEDGYFAAEARLLHN